MTTALIDPPRDNAAVTSRALTGVELLVLSGFCAFFFFFGLSALGLVGADEPRYAQIAREMLARHDWITPVLYGVPWLEKPILYYWEAMVSFRLFGVSDWAARLPSAVDASAMVLAVYVFMRRVRPGMQLDAALMVASCAGIVGFGRGASTDMPLTSMFTIAMLSWMAWLIERRKLWLGTFYFFLALGTLAKGPIAVFLAAAIVIVFAVVRRDWRLIARTLWVPGILLYLLTAAPWYIAVQMANHNFFHFFILEQNLARFRTNVYGHPQPFWYYWVVIPLSVLPWLVLVLSGLILGIRSSWSALQLGWKGAHLRTYSERHSDRLDEDGQFFVLFCFIWALVPAVFFSLSQSKLPGYILPGIPPLGVLAAAFLSRKTAEGRRSLGLVISHSAVVSAFAGAAMLSAYFGIGSKPPRAAWTTATIIAAGLFCAITLLLTLRGVRLVRTVTLVPVLIALTFVIRFAAPLIDLSQSARPVAKELAQVAPPKIIVAGDNIRRETQYGLAFYRNQPILNYDTAGIPKSEHILISRTTDAAGEIPQLKNRIVRRIGGFTPQELCFYWVDAAQ